MSTFLSQLNWRYATKSFDPARPVSDGQLAKILDSIRLAPTSFGLQPFHVYVIKDQPTKDRLFAAGWNQPQFKTASHVLCFASRQDVSARIDALLDLLSGGQAEARTQLAGYEGMMRGAFSRRGPDEVQRWADKQAYIALGFAMAACAELGIDSCPMEGFVPAQVDEILAVPPGQHVAVMLPIGFRPADAVVRPKTRFSEKDLFSK